MKYKIAWHSLSTKLVILFFLFTLLLMAIVGSGIRHTLENLYDQTGKAHIAKYLEYIRSDIGMPINYERASKLAKDLGIEISIIQNQQYWSSGNNIIDLDEIEIKLHKYKDGISYGGAFDDEQHFMVMQSNDIYYLFNTTDLISERKSFRAFKPLFFLLLILALLYFATRKLFAPILTIQNSVKRIGSGELDHKINIQRKDELGLLSKDINNMADDIQKMLDAKQQLLLAVSHELRTPLTRSNVALEMLDDSVYKKQLKSDIVEMEKLIADILETERLNTHHQTLDKTVFSINTLIKNVIDEHFSKDGIITSTLENDIKISADIKRIKLVLKNLIDNALRYKKEKVKVKALHNSDGITLCISDDGEGIAKDNIAKLTDPFYRVDSARQRQTGGYGLGLYLCKAIIEAHQGKLEIESSIGVGTNIHITLP